MYLISACDQAHLNFIFHSSIESREKKSGNADSLSSSVEERILSYGNSYNYAYKNILQFLSLSKSDYIYPSMESPLEYFKYVQFTAIFNLLRQGKNSLAISFLKILVDVYKYSKNKETIEMLLNLLFETVEYDLEFCLTSIHEIFAKLDNKQPFEYVIELLKFKLLALRGQCTEDFHFDKYPLIKHNVYYRTMCEYFKLYAIIQSEVALNENEKNLLKFKQNCKKYKLVKFNHLANFLLTSVYVHQKRFTEAISVANKTIAKARDEHTILRGKIALSKIYCRMGTLDQVKKLIGEVTQSMDKVGGVVDKADVLAIQSQLLILEGRNQDSILQLFNFLSLSLTLSHKENLRNSFCLLRSVIPSQKLQLLKSALGEQSIQSDNLFKMLTNFVLSKQQEAELLLIIKFHSAQTTDKIKNILFN